MQASYRAIEALLLAVLSETCGRVEIYEHRILLGTVQTDMCVPQFVNDRHGISLSLEDPAKRWLRPLSFACGYRDNSCRASQVLNHPCHAPRLSRPRMTLSSRDTGSDPADRHPPRGGSLSQDALRLPVFHREASPTIREGLKGAGSIDFNFPKEVEGWEGH